MASNKQQELRSCLRQPKAETPSSQLDGITKELQELRGLVHFFGSVTPGLLGVPLKRKEPERSDAPAKTLDPRKRPRIVSPEEERLRSKIADQERRIAELEGRRTADETELTSMRTCLKDVLAKAEASQELMQRLESEVQLKEKAVQELTDARKMDTASTARNISSLQFRKEAVERERDMLQVDLNRQREYSSRLYTQVKFLKGDSRTSSHDLAGRSVTERASHTPQSRRR